MNEQNPSTARRITASDALIEGLLEMGVTHLFANFGSDHPEVIEALALLREQGRPSPRVLVCPHESVALAAAHGHAMVSGQGQAVFVHVDVGTQTLGGALHNACRARMPVFIFAGETPFTIDGELFGTRNRPVQTLQDIHDQHGIVRPYVKWSAPMRTGQNAKQLVYRAMQLAHSEPRGPVYLTGPRELMSETIATPAANSSDRWPPQSAAGLPEPLAREIVDALAGAERPLIITAYAGRNPAAVAGLIKLAETLAVPVVQESPSAMNFPADNPFHNGFDAAPLVPEADVILVVDCDVPWMTATTRHRDDARIYHLDCDPLKVNIPLWHLPASRVCQVDSVVALEQLTALADGIALDPAVQAARAERAATRQREQRAAATAKGEAQPGVITPEFLCATLQRLIDDDTILVDESITNSHTVQSLIPRNRPGTYFSSGGSSLGFSGGGAIGAALAAPGRTVVSLTGDGSYLFSVPSATHFIANRYAVPFLTVIFNNGGWNATKQNTLRLHPDGAAKRNDTYWVGFGQQTDLAGIAAAAGGSAAYTVTAPGELEGTLAEALATVRAGRPAVVDVRLPKITEQTD